MLHDARKRRDPIRIAQAKDAVRDLMAHGSLSPELFEGAVLALIDPAGAHIPGAGRETLPYRWRVHADADVTSPADAMPGASVS